MNEEVLQQKTAARSKDTPKHQACIAACDLVLLLVSFYTIHFLKYQTAAVRGLPLKFFFFALGGWLLFGLLLKKFSAPYTRNLRQCFALGGVNACLMLALTALLLITIGLFGVSRFLVYGTVFLFAGLEFVALLIYFGRVPSKTVSLRELISAPEHAWENFSTSLFIADVLILAAAFYSATIISRGRFEWISVNVDALTIVAGAWLVSSMLIRKFNREHFNTSYAVLETAFKSLIFLLFIVSIVLFSFHYYFSRTQLFAVVILFGLMEFGLFFVFYRYQGFKEKARNDTACLSALPNYAQTALKQPDASNAAQCLEPAGECLCHALDFFDPALCEFLRENVDLGSVDRARTELTSSDNLFNIQVLEKDKYHLIANLHKVNDIRFLNQYFLAIHDKLKVHGWVVVKAHTLSTHRKHVLKQFSLPALGKLVLGLDFIFNRVCPKLPWTKKVYFAITKGRNRRVSRAEILGRLIACGLRPVAENVINESFYVIAQKTHTPCEDPRPTYGPLVGLKRSGLDGKTVTVYKFRTMYPFSEYLQNYVHEQNSLAEGGKFNEDFRVTAWGLWMRKLWIDELPMIYNWLRGDLHIVGVRPLSSQYLELYDPELRELRKKVKPGLVPPFYVDLPKTLEEICESERRYIEAYLQKPIRTQWRYFWKAFWNIGFKGARSR